MLRYVGKLCGVHVWSDSEMTNGDAPRLLRSQECEGEYDVSVSIGGARELFARYYPRRATLSMGDFVALLSRMPSPFDWPRPPADIEASQRQERERVNELAQARERSSIEAFQRQERERAQELWNENARLRHMIDLQREELQRLQQQDRVPDEPPDPPEEPRGRKIVL